MKSSMWDPVRQMERKDALQLLDELPARRYIDAQRKRVADAHEALDAAGFGGPNFDQYPGKRTPYNYSLWYGPISMQTPRRDEAGAGFELLAPLVTPGTYITPYNGNLVMGRDATFWWEGWAAYSYFSWTYTTAPGYTAPVAGRAAGNLFDPVFPQNGGAHLLLNQAGPTVFINQPRLCFEIELYDKRRGRYLTEDKLPAEVCLPGMFAPRPLLDLARFAPDTEVEPRIYVTEFRMSNDLDATTPYNAASVVGWINLIFTGAQTLEMDEVANLEMPQGVLR